MKTWAVLLLSLSLASGAWADAPSAVRIARQRILLSDVLPDAPEALGATDLGPAPPPGRSLLLSFDDVSLRLRALGVAASRLNLPKSGVRIESLAKVFSPAELESMVRPSIEAELPPGAAIVGLHVTHDAVLSPDAQPGTVRIGEIRARAGRAREVATVELLWGSTVALRLPVTLDLRVAERPESAPVQRGTVLTLTIVKGNVEVSVLAETLALARIGDSVMLRTQATKKVVSARLVASTRAEVTL